MFWGFVLAVLYVVVNFEGVSFPHNGYLRKRGFDPKGDSDIILKRSEFLFFN